MTRTLYNSPGVNINDLLHEAHPEGSANIIDSPTHEGVVEDSVEAQMKAMRMVYKQPTAKVLASLAETLESFGAMDMADSVDTIGYNFYHEALLERNLTSLAEVPAPIDFGNAGGAAAGGAAAVKGPGVAARSGTALMNVLKSAPARAAQGAGSFVYGPGAMGVGQLAGAGAAGVGTIAASVVVAAAAGYAVGAVVIEPLLDWLGFTKLLGYLQSLFDDGPYAAAIQSIEDSLGKFDEKTSLDDADRILRRAKSQAAVILKAPDVEEEEREAVGHLLEKVQQLDQHLADATAKFLAEQKVNPGASNMSLLAKQYTETKKLIDAIQVKAEQISAVSENQKNAEIEINKVFAPNVEKIQQFKRIFTVIMDYSNNKKDLGEKIKARAAQANNEMLSVIGNMDRALDVLLS